MKIMLSVYQCYHILMTAKKGLNVGNIIYGHKTFFPAKIHSLNYLCTMQIIHGGSILIFIIDNQSYNIPLLPQIILN